MLCLSGVELYSRWVPLLSDLVSMYKTQKNSYFQTRSERLIIIFRVQHIQRQNTRPDEQRYGTSSPFEKVH